MAATPTPKLAWDDVEVGAEAPAVAHQLGRTDLVKYAGASGDYNPMHTDEVAAQAAGLPSVFGHGMFSMGLLGRALTDWAGAGNLTNYKVRFTKQTWPGETLTTTVVVTAEARGGRSAPRRRRCLPGQPGRRSQGGRLGHRHRPLISLRRGQPGPRRRHSCR